MPDACLAPQAGSVDAASLTSPADTTILRVTMSEGEVHRAAEAFVTRALLDRGIPVEETGESGLLLVRRGRGRALVRVLPARAPHLRGRRGASLGLHWMLRDERADFVALVDLSRDKCWLLPADDFRRRSQLLSGPRFHLDWLVARAAHSRGRVADEAEFDEYLMGAALPRYFPLVEAAGL